MKVRQNKMSRYEVSTYSILRGERLHRDFPFNRLADARKAVMQLRQNSDRLSAYRLIGVSIWRNSIEPFTGSQTGTKSYGIHS